MYKAALIFVPAFIASTSAAALDWVPLATTEEYTWEGRAGTLKPGITRAKIGMWTAMGRVFEKKTQRYTFEQWYVTQADCRSGFGKVVTVNMDGAFKFDTEFILKGGSVASSLAEMLCSVELSNEQKGI